MFVLRRLAPSAISPEGRALPRAGGAGLGVGLGAEHVPAPPSAARSIRPPVLVAGSPSVRSLANARALSLGRFAEERPIQPCASGCSKTCRCGTRRRRQDEGEGPNRACAHSTAPGRPAAQSASPRVAPRTSRAHLCYGPSTSAAVNPCFECVCVLAVFRRALSEAHVDNRSTRRLPDSSAL